MEDVGENLRRVLMGPRYVVVGHSEERHTDFNASRSSAALAWRTVAWALGGGEPAVREAVLRVFAAVLELDPIDR